ncbi:MAG: metalloregulator ArsR/SmtB family transcription factor [Rhodobacteraceae bacterium]|nr:metalloregulator ArsR/SmtB family transcription factor [Paracoccaceae bacterium]
MEIITAADIFSILGHPDRLSVFRLLMRFAPRGQRPTEIAQALGLKQNTLSHHLRDLVACGMVRVTRQGRSLYYCANLDMAETLIGYLALDVGRARPDLLAPLTAGRPSPLGGADGQNAVNVLFVCSGNSARSIMAEALLRDLGAGRFNAFSAGTCPANAPNRAALQVLQQNGHDLRNLQSQHIREFQTADAPQMDFVFTVCDMSAADDCAPWQGYPMTGHWGVPDPVLAQTEQDAALPVFVRTYTALRRKIAAFVALPVTMPDRAALQTRIDAIALIQQEA